MNESDTRPASNLVAKLLIVGDSRVGKSCMLTRFTEACYTPNSITTVGIDCKLVNLLLPVGGNNSYDGWMLRSDRCLGSIIKPGGTLVWAEAWVNDETTSTSVHRDAIFNLTSMFFLLVGFCETTNKLKGTSSSIKMQCTTFPIVHCTMFCH